MTEADAKHPKYVEMKPVWDLCSDAAIGERAIKAGGTKYLPKLSGQEDGQYAAYLERASYFNATGRTLEGMHGLVFRKTPARDVPAALDAWLEDITMTGKSLDGIAREMIDEVLKKGRYGILIDHPVAPLTDGSVKITKGQAESLDLRPYMTAYTADNILNWQTGRVGNVTKTVLVSLLETADNGEPQIRHLVLNGQYEQLIYQKKKNGDKEDWVLVGTVVPLKNGKPLNEIPFWFVGSEETTGDTCNPPIEDLARLNVSLFRNSADRENAAHLTGVPTPYVTGVDDGNLEMNLGSTSAWILPNPESKVGFLQLTGEGLGALKELMVEKKEEMAALGARLIAPEKKAAEAAETANIRRGAESSVLADIVGSANKPLQSALEFMAEWGNVSGTIKYELNKDYIIAPLNAQELTALLAAVQAGRMSFQTYFGILQAGEVVPETLTFEQEQQRILEDGPALGEMADEDADDQ